jgi:phosphate transport system permease protein
VLGALRGSGSTLTSYIFENSPAGEGGAPEKAYAAAFVLLVFVMLLNLIVGRIGRSQADSTGLTVAGAVV